MMNTSFKITFILIGLIFCLASCSEISNTNTKTLKLAHGLDIFHPVHKGMEYMAAQVEKKSGGSLRIEIYPSQQLGAERQCLELLQIGSLSMAKVSAAVLENFAPNMQVLSIPYIFRSRAHNYKVLDGEIGKKLLVQSEKFRLRGLTYFDAGQRSFYSKEPIRVPSDLNNKKSESKKV